MQMETAHAFKESLKTGGHFTDDLPPLVYQPSIVVDDDLNDLISEAKAFASVKKERTQSMSSATKPQQSLTYTSKAKSHTAFPEGSIKGSKHTANNEDKSGDTARNPVSIQESNEDHSDASEGEIRESQTYPISRPLTSHKEPQPTTKLSREDGQLRRKGRNEEKGRFTREDDSRAAFPHRGSPAPAAHLDGPRLQPDHQKDVDGRFDRNNDESTYKHERRYQPEPEQKSSLRRDSRDTTAVHHKHELKNKGRNEERTLRTADTPTLAQLLLVDEDLKEWLDVTGYHHTEYRNKILNRRRAIAALDAQKAKLLNEEIEERGGLQPQTNSQTSVLGMLPPVIPTKMGAVTPTIASSIVASVNKVQELPIRSADEKPSAESTNHETGNKRSYADYHGTTDEGSAQKVGRVDEQGRGIRIKSNGQSEDRQSYTGRPNTARRRSMSPDSRRPRHDERGSYRRSPSRDRGRDYTRQCDVSPDDQEYEKRPRTRSKHYGFSSPDERDDRPFVWRGNYRGRAFDPNYRGRGRGNRNWKEPGDRHFEQRENQQFQAHGQRLAYLKPYRDTKPLDLGGKGG
jgi:hypothetical protein